MSNALKVMTVANFVATIAALASLWFGWAEVSSGLISVYDWLSYPLLVIMLVWLVYFSVRKKMGANNDV